VNLQDLLLHGPIGLDYGLTVRSFLGEAENEPAIPVAGQEGRSAIADRSDAPAELPDDAVVGKVQALLLRARHPGTNEHEAEVCARKVQELLSKHHLALAEVEPSLVSDRHARGMESSGHGVQHEWSLRAASAVAEATATRLIRAGAVGKLVFLGTAPGVAVAAELYRLLAEQITGSDAG